MKNYVCLSGILLSAILIITSVQAQNFQGREPTPGDTLTSPRILSGNKVQLSIYAPKAEDVLIFGDFGAGGPLTKDDLGVWSSTIGPLTPDFYSYSFRVDGVKTLDPRNPMIKQGIRGVDNMFFLPGEEAAFEDNHPVPHGAIRKAWYLSSTFDMQRRLHIYTPPGYDEGNDRYPVFYLLHGGGDEDSGWSTIGRAGFILDNLLAQDKAVPMIIVMPNGSLPRPQNQSFDAASYAEYQQRFTRELMNDIVPFVERTYRTKTGREYRALAGLSMGGGQTLQVMMNHPNQFAYIGIWSAGLFNQDPEEFQAANEAFFNDATSINRQIQLLSISVGDQDFALVGSENLAKLLEASGIEVELHISGGGHTWINWRHYLRDFAPRLFR